MPNPIKPPFGLSPRGRGKRQYLAAEMRAWGSIPAWAGETGGRNAFQIHSVVYPRVGGGN